jgi:hypothetical protein
MGVAADQVGGLIADLHRKLNLMPEQEVRRAA